MYVFLDFKVVIIKKGEIVEASFTMMNQVDSSSFDDIKDDDKKPKKMISRLSQERFKIQDQDSRLKDSRIKRRLNQDKY